MQGGSTLTMQLVRVLYTQDVTRAGIEGYKRKIREARLAQELENEHSKEWVLSRYLNSVPYGTFGGQTAIGAEAAARLYFDKPVKELTLREAAMLAGMPQAPSEYSPVDNPSGTKARRDEVLGKMAELGMITPAERARRKRTRASACTWTLLRAGARALVLDYVKSELIKEYGIDKVQRGGMRGLHDDRPQQAARGARGDRQHDGATSGLRPRSSRSTRKNGDIVAMASSQTYGRSKGKSTFNLAAQGHRQPGSSFKIMALLTALREGVEPELHDLRLEVRRRRSTRRPAGRRRSREIKTYSAKGGGSMNLVRATLASDNSVYIQLAADLGPDKVKETARMMGIKSKLSGYCAETLGGLENGVSPLEMANAYATIANGGYRNRPRAIRRSTSATAPTSCRALARAPRQGVLGRRHLRGDEDPRAEHPGRHRPARADRMPGGRQDRHDDKNIDAWFVGFTPRLSTAVWVGFPGSTPVSMNGMSATARTSTAARTRPRSGART